MQDSREYRVTLSNFNHQFTGTISSLSSKNNPYLKKAQEIAKEKDIPQHSVSNTKIIVRGNDVTFTFRWVVEVEAPEDEKIKVLAYIGNIPKEGENVYIPVFVERESGIYKTYIYDSDELHNDYIIDDNSKQIQEHEEIRYINSLNIDFEERYLKALVSLAEDYSDEEFSDEQIKEFLALKKVKAFILEEDAQSLTDTAPREVLLDWMEEEFPPEY